LIPFPDSLRSFFKLKGSNAVDNGFRRIGSVKFAPRELMNRSGTCIGGLMALTFLIAWADTPET
jgi:hypothetical protein